MGARGKNFYNDLARRYGYVDEAIEIQDLYLAGQKDAAAAKVPADWLEKTSLVGPPSYVAERVAAYKEAGVTVLAVNAYRARPRQDHRAAPVDRRRLTRPLAQLRASGIDCLGIRDNP